LRRFFRGEAVTGDIFGYDARQQELQEIIGATGLRPAAAHFESAEGVTSNNRTGAGAINVNVAGDNFRLGAFDIRRTA
jgi:hypothetical protein